MLTPAELAAHLRISVRQVQRHVSDGMPFQPSGVAEKWPWLPSDLIAKCSVVRNEFPLAKVAKMQRTR